jgi:SAM-dependent methyltransferase
MAGDTYGIDDLAELREYLGPKFDQRRLENWERGVEDELLEVDTELELYRTSEAYLYNLAVFAMTEIKIPYLRSLEDLLPAGARVLDYGCGIGADGLRLLADGFDVAFADFDNPSTRFLRWRLERRGIDAPIFDLDRDTIPSDFDAAFAFDVLEHVDDPLAVLQRMEAAAGLVAVNLLESLPEEDENELHRELPIRALLARAAAREPFRYHKHHGRSHLVIYGRGAAARSRALIRGARVRFAARGSGLAAGAAQRA